MPASIGIMGVKFLLQFVPRTETCFLQRCRQDSETHLFLVVFTINSIPTLKNLSQYEHYDG